MPILVAAAALAVALVAMPGAVGARASSVESKPLVEAKPAVVTMTDMAPYFAPAKITIRAGGTVKWVNGGSKVHSVSTDRASAFNPKHVATPKGAAPLNSGFIPPGGNYSHTFIVPGTYRYVCLPHERGGEVGEVAVRK